MREEDLKELKDSVMVSLNLLPENAQVGIVTFGTMVQVHEIGFQECPKAYVFKGSKDYTGKEVQDMLGLTTGQRGPVQPRPGQPTASQMSGYARFIQPVKECEFNLTSLLEQLQCDSWPVANDKRRLRSTGTAIAVATSLIEASFTNGGARILLFSSGACTEGSGLIVSSELKEAIRTHHDIEQDTAKHIKKATKFYEGIAARCCEKGITLDVFAACLDQIGIMEMRSIINRTNGYIVLADSFSSAVFKQCLNRVFAKDEQGFLKIGFNCIMEVNTSRELKVCGLIGPAVSANKKGANVGDMEIGVGNTNAWKLASITPNTTVAIYFEIAPQVQNFQPGTYGIIQFTSIYQHPSGQTRMRVTTVPRLWAEPSSPQIEQSFDQEAAAILMARICSFKSENDDGPDVLRWLDRMLIRVVNVVDIVSKIR